MGVAFWKVLRAALWPMLLGWPPGADWTGGVLRQWRHLVSLGPLTLTRMFWSSGPEHVTLQGTLAQNWLLPYSPCLDQGWGYIWWPSGIDQCDHTLSMNYSYNRLPRPGAEAPPPPIEDGLSFKVMQRYWSDRRVSERS